MRCEEELYSNKSDFNFFISNDTQELPVAHYW